MVLETGRVHPFLYLKQRGFDIGVHSQTCPAVTRPESPHPLPPLKDSPHSITDFITALLSPCVLTWVSEALLSDHLVQGADEDPL